MKVAEAEKDESDAKKWLRLCQEDQAHHENLSKIMASAKSLEGKEYLDYLLKFLRDGSDAVAEKELKANERRHVRCRNELTAEECKKLAEVLKDEKMVLYISATSGFKVLVDSLYLNSKSGVLAILQDKLTSDDSKKLQDDFQRDHLYEALIDFMNLANQNAEGKTLSLDEMLTILQILEAGSLNEQVRHNLSDKKKIKDLFLVVVRSVKIPRNKKLLAALIQFVANLCHGSGKLKQMLSREDSREFFMTIAMLLKAAKVVVPYEDTLAKAHDAEAREESDSSLTEEQRKKAHHALETAQRLTLRSAIYAFIGNLCGEASLRKKFASDFEGVLSQVSVDFRTDLTEASFDWVDMVFKQLAFLVNVSLEAEGQRQMFELELLPDIETLLKRCNSTDAAQRATLERCLNLLSKVVK